MYGSHAALKIVVSPCAMTAAIIILAVPVTEASLRSMYVPFNPPSGAVATWHLLPSSNVAPSFCNPMICVSRRRRPILSPPGFGRYPLPNLASIGPKIITLPLRRVDFSVNFSDSKYEKSMSFACNSTTSGEILLTLTPIS